MTSRAFFESFGLDSSSVDFVGHAMALHADESYLDQPALETVDNIKLYAQSLAAFGRSPFIYPQYGLGTLPESFSRYVSRGAVLPSLHVGCASRRGRLVRAASAPSTVARSS
jgi:RAB protein geranylgeranyltransferase component A